METAVHPAIKTKAPSLLEIDADLAAAVPEREREAAARRLVADTLEVEPGPWEGLEREPETIGLLVVEGFLTRDVVFAGALSRELLATGDVLRPWDVEDDLFPTPPESGWTVLEPTRLARIDASLLGLGARWPRLLDQIIHRIVDRTRWLAVRLAITGVTRVDERLLFFFWHAAGRWGRVTPEGTVIELPLTHEILGELIGARRPSVTTALNGLRSEGRLEQLPGGWLLRGEPPAPGGRD
jgi:CRP/FNR family cyclic AMP-dependent transcriptional regulator